MNPRIECSELRSLAIKCAIGRILEILSRTFREGDFEEYERCRSIVLDQLDSRDSYEVNYASDRLKGAQGD